MIIKVILKDNSILLYSDVKKFDLLKDTTGEDGIYINDEFVSSLYNVKNIYVMNEDGKTIDKISGSEHV